MPSHYYDGNLYPFALLHDLDGDADAARLLRDEAGTSSFAPWSEIGGPADALLSNAANSAYVDAALGEPSTWTSAAYDLIGRWPRQFYGNIVWNGPTETALAAIAPLAGHGDDLDRLLTTALDLSDAMPSPLLQMSARVFGASGSRLRNRPGDRERAARLVDQAIALGDRIGAGFAQRRRRELSSTARLTTTRGSLPCRRESGLCRPTGTRTKHSSSRPRYGIRPVATAWVVNNARTATQCGSSFRQRARLNLRFGMSTIALASQVIDVTVRDDHGRTGQTEVRYDLFETVVGYDNWCGTT